MYGVFNDRKTARRRRAFIKWTHERRIGRNWDLYLLMIPFIVYILLFGFPLPIILAIATGRAVEMPRRAGKRPRRSAAPFFCRRMLFQANDQQLLAECFQYGLVLRRVAGHVKQFQRFTF